MTKEISGTELKESIENSNKPIVIDFYATWCGPCKVSEPVFNEFSNKNSDNLEFYKVDVDQNEEISTKYGIKSIPSFLLIENGEVKKRMVGVATREKLEDLISEYKLN